MKRDIYRDKYEKLLERKLALAEKRIERMQKDLDFYRGKCDRLELSLLSTVPSASRFVDAPAPRAARPNIQRTPAEPERLTYREIRDHWNSLTTEEQEKAIENGLEVPVSTKEGA